EGVELIFDDKHPKSVRIESDQNRLTQVIANLLTNACKFTREGAIHFGFDLHGNMIDFYVRDSGVGIAPEKVNNIFERFVKLNNFAVGTGLGLSISKMIVEKMGGTIGVESQLGKGSCFHFSLPIRRTVQPE
ncbi:MAG: HAMP domain-containing sensor histidine kinase, partial [Alistipes sp.]